MATATVHLKMEESRIVPDIIDKAPKGFVQITFPSGVKVELGNELTPTEVKDLPTLHWDAEGNALYTLLMTDLDPPAHLKEARHWLVVNIPGNKIAEGKSVVDFVSSGPTQGSGIHRYVFLVFKQTNAIETDVYIPANSTEGRLRTKTRDIIKQYNLGDPVAGNFYRAQYDDYVPILQAKMNAPKPKAN